MFLYYNSIISQQDVKNQITVCGNQTIITYDTTGTNAVDGYWICHDPNLILVPFDTSPLHYSTYVFINHPENFFLNPYEDVYCYYHYDDTQLTHHIDSILVRFYQKPLCLSKVDTLICGKSITANFNYTIEHSTGMWYSISGNPGTAIFSDINSPNTNITVSNYGTYTFVWKEMNSENSACFCLDTLIVNFVFPPMPDAGIDISICESPWAYICATPTAPGFTGSWSGPTGIQFYDNINGNIAPHYKDSPCVWIRWPYNNYNDTITMYWTEFNGICYGYDSVNIYFHSIIPAIILTNNVNNKICGDNVFHNLEAYPPQVGYGYWIDNIPNTTFAPHANNPNVDVIIDTSYYGIHNIQWITVNGPCRDTSDVFTIHFMKYPIALFDTNIIINNLPYNLIIQNLSQNHYYNEWFFWNADSTTVMYSNQNNYSINITEPDCYNIMLIAYSMFCGADTMIHHFCISSYQELSAEAPFKLFPNPLNNGDVVYISTTEHVYDINVWDVYGNCILTYKQYSYPYLPVNSLKNGIYFVEIRTSSKVQTQKLLITR